MLKHVDELFPVLLRSLSDLSDEVVQLDLEVLAEIISSPAGNKKPVGEGYHPLHGECFAQEQEKHLFLSTINIKGKPRKVK